MNYSFELLRELDDNSHEIEEFIKTTNNSINLEEIKTKTTFIKQLLGYYNQIILRVQDIFPKEELNAHITIQKDFSNKIESLEKEMDIRKKIDALTVISNNLINNYNNLTTKSLFLLKNDNSSIEYNNLIRKINENIVKLNNLELSKSNIDNLLPLYNDIKMTKDISKLNSFLNITNNMLINNIKTNVNDKKGKETERVFSLFAKINDQIIESNYNKSDNLVYALYVLEDNSKYYAIIKDTKEIEILDQSFSNLPNLVLTKDNIINTCRIIIRNAGIYYDINEYMRYIEKSYKNKITKEIDEVILKYKNRLKNLENNINAQLAFIDTIALLVNHKPCPKYPNITYNDLNLEDYFPDYDKETDSKEKEIERLIVEVLLNPNIKSEFDTNSILKTLYESSILDSLVSSNYLKENNRPIVNTSDNISNSLEVTNNIKTNYDKVKDYLNIRVEELKLLESSPKINVTITKDDNSLFKDINTVLDLNTALVICNKVYKRGQGEYAVIDYLKTGNTLKFTSKYKARELASSVNRDNYLKLLLENIIKRFLYNKDNNNFIESILSKDSISIEDIVNSLLADNNLLITSITNFDYDYLDNTSNKFIRVEEILNNKEDLMIVKINKILEEIKRTEKIILESY